MYFTQYTMYLPFKFVVVVICRLVLVLLLLLQNNVNLTQ